MSDTPPSGAYQVLHVQSLKMRFLVLWEAPDGRPIPKWCPWQQHATWFRDFETAKQWARGVGGLVICYESRADRDKVMVDLEEGVAV